MREPTFSSPGGVEGADLALFLLILTVSRDERVGAGEAVLAEGETGGDSVSARGLLARDLELPGSFGVSGRASRMAESSTCR